MTRDDWFHLAKILGEVLLLIAIGAAIVLLIFGIGGFPPE